ncbi:MAG: ATP-binding protein [Acidimicrobiales bacterium]
MPSLRARTSTIRFRITVIAGLLVAIVLTASAIGLVVLQRQQLMHNLDASLEQRSDQLGEILVEGGEPSLVVANSNDEDRAAQVMDPAGTVLAATTNLEGEAPIATLAADEDQRLRTVSDLPLEDDTYRTLSRRVETPSGTLVLNVAENIDDLRDAIRGLTWALSIAVPGVVIFVMSLVWWLVGRTLRPVESLRAEVTAITDTSTERRVPVPPHDDEISRLATTMNAMLDRLAEAGENQRRFVADASHELRSPLTRIRTELEVDLNQPERADLAATHGLVLEETVALQQLVDDLLYLARADANAAPLRRRPTDLDDIVLSEVRRVREGQAVTIDAAGVTAAHAEVDPGQTTRVVRNLLDNAIRHATSSVKVQLRELDGAVELRITDDGPGVPAGRREDVFARFARLDDARARDEGGTGLGLAISREIAVRHGGSLVIDPDHRGGASFVLTLPR